MHIKDRSSIHENKGVEAFWKEQLSSEVLDFSVFNSGYQLNKENPCEHVQVIMNVEFSKSIQKVIKSQDLLLFRLVTGRVKDLFGTLYRSRKDYYWYSCN